MPTAPSCSTRRRAWRPSTRPARTSCVPTSKRWPEHSTFWRLLRSAQLISATDRAAGRRGEVNHLRRHPDLSVLHRQNPSAGGLDFPVSPTGPNANNINSAYYQAFSLRIVTSTSPSTSARSARASPRSTPPMAPRPCLTRPGRPMPPFARDGRPTPRSTPRPTPASTISRSPRRRANGIGAKAAMVGWLPAEAVKGPTSACAKSNDALLTDLADGATLAINLGRLTATPEYV